MGLGEKPTAFKLIEREMAAIPCGGALVPVPLTPALLRLDGNVRSDPQRSTLLGIGCGKETVIPNAILIFRSAKTFCL